VRPWQKPDPEAPEESRKLCSIERGAHHADAPTACPLLKGVFRRDSRRWIAVRQVQFSSDDPQAKFIPSIARAG